MVAVYEMAPYLRLHSGTRKRGRQPLSLELPTVQSLSRSGCPKVEFWSRAKRAIARSCSCFVSTGIWAKNNFPTDSRVTVCWGSRGPGAKEARLMGPSCSLFVWIDAALLHQDLWSWDVCGVKDGVSDCNVLHLTLHNMVVSLEWTKQLIITYTFIYHELLWLFSALNPRD